MTGNAASTVGSSKCQRGKNVTSSVEYSLLRWPKTELLPDARLECTWEASSKKEVNDRLLKAASDRSETMQPEKSTAPTSVTHRICCGQWSEFSLFVR